MYIYIRVCMWVIVYICHYVSLTVKGAGHRWRVGAKQLSGISLGVFQVSIDPLRSKPKQEFLSS